MSESTAPVASAPPEKARWPLSRKILLSVLALMIVALAWDWLYARPQSEKAWEEVQKLVDEKNAAAYSQDFSPEKVAERLGRKSSTGLIAKDHYHEEYYRWMPGIPFKEWYYIHVIYIKGNPPMLHAANFNAPCMEIPGRHIESMPVSQDAIDSREARQAESVNLDEGYVPPEESGAAPEGDEPRGEGESESE